MILLTGNHVKGTALFEDPEEAWNFKMRKQLDGANVRINEKTTTVLGVKVLCDPRAIVVRWKY